MKALIIPPDKSSYAVTTANELVSTTVASGATRYRRDMIGAKALINVQWQCGPEEYRYIMAFYRAVLVEGSNYFTMMLLLDTPELTEHACHFVPGSLKLASHTGLTYFITATVEATPTLLSDVNGDIVIIYPEFGPDFLKWEDLLNTIVNIQIPGIGQ